MKYTIKVLIFILFLIIIGNAFAGEKSEIRLSDGSVFYGEIVSATSSLYVIKTESMGTVKINKSKIKSINFGSMDNGSFSSSSKKQTGSGKNNLKAKTASLKELMINDKQMMTSIMGLKNHPDFKAVLSDQTILEDINSGNINQLLSNPKIQKLLKNQTVKEISRQLPN